MRQALIKGVTIIAVIFSMLSLGNMYRIVLAADIYADMYASVIVFLISGLWLSLFTTANGLPRIFKWLF